MLGLPWSDAWLDAVTIIAATAVIFMLSIHILDISPAETVWGGG